jgi:hypothetical protein
MPSHKQVLATCTRWWGRGGNARVVVPPKRQSITSWATLSGVDLHIAQNATSDFSHTLSSERIQEANSLRASEA